MYFHNEDKLRTVNLTPNEIKKEMSTELRSQASEMQMRSLS